LAPPPVARSDRANLTGTVMTARLARLKTRADFLRVAAGRGRAVRLGLILQAAPRPAADAANGGLRVGFTASRRVGNAVARNRAKRRLRAVAAAALPRHARDAMDYVLIARAGTGKRPYAELLGDLETALRQMARPRRAEER
jgi:ribonuclease P protein component